MPQDVLSEVIVARRPGEATGVPVDVGTVEAAAKEAKGDLVTIGVGCDDVIDQLLADDSDRGRYRDDARCVIDRRRVINPNLPRITPCAAFAVRDDHLETDDLIKYSSSGSKHHTRGAIDRRTFWCCVGSTRRETVVDRIAVGVSRIDIAGVLLTGGRTDWTGRRDNRWLVGALHRDRDHLLITTARVAIILSDKGHHMLAHLSLGGLKPEQTSLRVERCTLREVSDA